jgi:hypothetical protein
MMNDFADSFIEMVIYICFMLGISYIMMKLVWLSTNDYVFGTWLELYDDGSIVSVTTRVDEGDESFVVRPSDDEIRRKLP